MAKKESYRFDDDVNFNLDDADWGGDDPFQPTSSNRNSRSPVMKAGSSLLRGARDETKNIGFYKSILKAALPESFSTTLDTVDDLANIGQRSYQQALRDAKPMATQARKIAGSLNRLIPSPFQSKIDEYLKSKEKKSYDAAQIDMEEATVTQGVGDIFKEQEQDDRKLQQAEKLLEYTTEREYRKNVLNQLSGIHRQLSLQTENQLRVQRAWQHKTLEVQLRQLFVQRGLLAITQKGMEENSMLLRDVVKNTALPDIQKEQRSETMARLTRERLFGAAQSKVSDWARSSRYIKAVGERFNAALRQRMQTFQLGLQSGAEMFESVEEQMRAAKEFGMDTTEMGGELAGSSLAKRLGEWVGKKVGKRLKLNKADNFFRTLNFRKDMAGHYLSRYGKQLKQSNSRIAQWLGEILDVPITQDTTIANGGLADMRLRGGKLNMEDRKLQALEVTIPGYLSRILQEVNGIRTGTMSDRIVFDPQKGNFTTMHESVAGLSQQVISDDTINSAQSSLNDLITRMGGENLTRAQRNELGKFLRDKAKDGTWGFTPEDLLDPTNGMSTPLRGTLSQNLVERYGLTEDETTGRYRGPLKGMSGIRSLERDVRSFNTFRDYASDAYTNIKSLYSMGGLEQLLAMGAVHWDDRTQTYEISDDYIENRSNAKFRQQNWRSPSLGDNATVTGAFDAIRRPYGNDGTAGNGPRAAATPLDDSEGSSEGGLKRFLGKDKQSSVVKAIRDLNISLLDAYDNMPVRTVQEEQADILADILDKLHSGIDTHGGVASPDGKRKSSLLRRAGKGVRRIAKAGWRIGGLPFKALGWAKKALTRPFKWGGGKAFGALRGIVNTVTGRAKKLVSDVYVMGQDGLRRAMESALLKAGGYTDVNTGKIIKSWKDITGAVMNNTTGEIVLTQEDYNKGLLNSMGERMRSGLVDIGKSLIKGIGRFAISPIMKPLALARSGLNAVRKLIMTPPDVYLRGQMDKPVLYGQQMYNGMYWSNTTNKPVKYVGDIDGDIYTWDKSTMTKRIVLTAQQIQDPGLVDSKGQPLIGFMKKWKDRIGSVVGFIGKNINPMTWLRRGKNMITGAARAVGGLFGGVSSALTGGGGITGSWPKRIYTLLWNKFNDLPLDQGLSPVTAGIGGAARKVGGYVRDKLGKMVKKPASLIGGLLSSIFRPGVGSKLMDLLRGRKSRLKERIDSERDREGSWVNRLAGMGKKVKDGLGNKNPITKKFPWLRIIMSGLGLVTGAIGYLRKKLSNWGGKLLGYIPKIISAISKTRLATSAMDMISSLGGGGMLGKAGKVIKTAGKAVGRIGSKLLGNVGSKIAQVGGRIGGRVLAQGGRVAARVGLSLAARALPLLTNPYFLIGAVVAAGVGYLIYKGYKAYAGRITSVREMRLAQYGFSKEDDSDKTGKVLALEEACMKAVKFDSQGNASLGKVDYNELMKAFGINEAAEKTRQNWAEWYVRRFRPVFLHNLKCIHDKNKKGDITDAYAGLDKGQLPDYALASRLPDKNPDGTPGPYFVDMAPFPNMSAIIGTKLVDATINKVVLEFRKDAMDYKAKKRKEDNLANVPNEAFGAKEGKQMAPGMQFTAGKERLYDTSEANKVVGTITGNVDADRKIVSGNVIDNITALRMRLYGMMQLNRSQVNTIMRMEESLIANNIIMRNKVAVFSGEVDVIMQNWGPMFGMAPNDEVAAADWRMWFNKRFLPVFLNFCTRGDKWVGLKELVTKVRTAHPERQYSIAEFMSIATTEINGKEKSIWVVSSYPFPDESANTDSLIIKPIMDAMRLAIKEQTYQDQVAADKLSKNPNTWKTGAAKKALADYATSHPDAAIASTYAGGAGGTSIQQTSFSADDFKNKYTSSIGQGDSSINAAGIPTLDVEALRKERNMGKRAKMLMPTFQAVSRLTGVDVGTLLAMTLRESGFQANAKAGTSSAKGLMQFIDDTWATYVPKLRKLGFSNPSVYDPAANITAGALFLKDNDAILRKSGVASPSLGDYYLAHFMGPGGAAGIIGADPNANWARLFPKQAKANDSIYKNNPTAGLLRKWAATTMDKDLDTVKSFGINVGLGEAVQPTSPFQTNMDAMGSAPATTPVETPAGSAPLSPDSVGSAPVSPSGLSNSDVITAPLPSSRTMNGSTPTLPTPQAVDPGRQSIDQQRARQTSQITETVQAQRVAAQSNQARNAREEASMQDTRAQSGLRERIVAATELSADKLTAILDYLTTGGTPTSAPYNTNKTREDLLMKNASSNIPVGRPSGALPFQTNHR